jgi:ferredoxin
MKVRIKDICTSCGLCLDICPDVFEMAWDAAEITVDEVPSTFEETVRQAADECPVEAIILE